MSYNNNNGTGNRYDFEMDDTLRPSRPRWTSGLPSTCCPFRPIPNSDILSRMMAQKPSSGAESELLGTHYIESEFDDEAAMAPNPVPPKFNSSACSRREVPLFDESDDDEEDNEEEEEEYDYENVANVPGRSAPIPIVRPKVYVEPPKPCSLSTLYNLEPHIWATVDRVLDRLAAGTDLRAYALNSMHTPISPCSPPNKNSLWLRAFGQ